MWLFATSMDAKVSSSVRSSPLLISRTGGTKEPHGLYLASTAPICTAVEKLHEVVGEDIASPG